MKLKLWRFLHAAGGSTTALIQAIVLGALAGCSATVRADEFDLLRQKWSDMLTGGGSYPATDPVITAAITSVTSTANSHWSALNKSPGRTNLWSDAASTTVSADLNTNYSRLRAMALAYATTGSTLKGSAALRDDIMGGLDWMYANRYNENVRIYDNWWHFEIGSPLALVDTVALMFSDLNANQISNYMRTVEKFTPSATTPAAGGSTGTFTGANRMWKIQVVIIRGLIVKDDAKLRAARDAFSNLFLYVTSGDGFYRDGSFIQHGKHPYTGGYGASLLGTIAPMLALLNGPNPSSPAGSTWRVTDPNLANVYRWVYQAYEPLIYRGGMMAMTQGREVSRSGSTEHGTGHSIMQSILRISQFAPTGDQARMRAMLKSWAESDTSRTFVGSVPLALKVAAQQLLADPAVAPREELKGNYIFASMDRVVHLGAGYGLGLSLSSTRIYTYESINSENLHGWYTGDGMMYLYNGDLTQFTDSFWPTVNPRRLPGTTVDAGQARANGSGQSTAPAHNWVGGASLGRFGVAGMQLDGWNNSLTAKKSWFMFDDEIVCLGAGITSTDNRTIETTVESRLLNPDGTNAFTVDGAARPAATGWSETMSGIRWAHLAGRVSGSDIGYFFPTATTLKGLREARTGAWSEINVGGSATPITRNYLTLWFDHGASPSDSTYAYAVLPGRNAAQVADYAARPQITVLENSPDVQAVRETTWRMTAANFWHDGRTTAGGITVDKKSCVVVQEDLAALEIAVSDPTQANNGSIVVELATAVRAAISVDAGITVIQLAPSLRFSADVAGARGKTFRARFAVGEAKPPAELCNLSTRAYLAPREGVLIAGFVVVGTGPKKLLIRAVGPTLSAFGVTDALANPRLAIMSGTGATLAENDDWSTGAGAAEVAATSPAVGAFGLPPGSRDAALVVALPPGLFSAVVRSVEPAAGGVALLEIYDPAPTPEARLVNLSSRSFSGSGTQTAIVGFVLAGDAPRQVLVRAAGPALASFGVAETLADPQLRLANGLGVIVAENDNWSGSPDSTAIVATASGVAAFAFGAASRDSAALVALNPGSYTALVTAAGNNSGHTLIEIYAVP